MLGIPAPIFNNRITIIANLDWPTITGEEVAESLGLKKLVFLNDFVVNGYGVLSNITEGVDFERVNNNKVDLNGPIAMIGAGTGLGHGYIIKNSGARYYHVYPAEGGHQDFAPQTDLEWKYHKYVQQTYNCEHVSVERAVSGPAIPTMYNFFRDVEKMEGGVSKGLSPEEIIQKGLKRECKICEKTVEFFTGLYAAAAGNMCLLLIPTGGLFLLGGLSVALEEYIIKSDVFRVKFIINI